MDLVFLNVSRQIQIVLMISQHLLDLRIETSPPYVQSRRNCERSKFYGQPSKSIVIGF